MVVEKSSTLYKFFSTRKYHAAFKASVADVALDQGAKFAVEGMGVFTGICSDCHLICLHKFESMQEPCHGRPEEI